MTRFVVDAMLGRLALWLRLTGNDTIYSPDIHDNEILEIAQDEQRVILTSDAELQERALDRKIESMLIRGDVDEGVVDVFLHYKIVPDVNPAGARCSKCNGELVELRGDNKKRIEGLVYEQTYEHYDVFWFCEECKSVYFQGGHWKNITAYMKRISELMGERTNN
jgi:uncharacterized protein with PIN domain